MTTRALPLGVINDFGNSTAPYFFDVCTSSKESKIGILNSYCVSVNSTSIISDAVSTSGRVFSSLTSATIHTDIIGQLNMPEKIIKNILN